MLWNRARAAESWFLDSDSLYSRSSGLTCGKQSLGLLPDVLYHPRLLSGQVNMKINVLWSVFHLVLLSYFIESLILSTFKTRLKNRTLQNKQKNRIKNVEGHHAFILNLNCSRWNVGVLFFNFSFEIFSFAIVIETAKKVAFPGAKSSLLKWVSSLSLCRECSSSVL